MPAGLAGACPGADRSLSVQRGLSGVRERLMALSGVLTIMRGETAEPVSIRDALAAAEISCRERKKNPAVAAGLSLLFNGLGQAYNGQFVKGVLVLLGSLLGLFLLIVPGVAVWLWGGYDAWATARRMNEGLVPYRETSALAIIGFLVVWAATIFLLSAASAMLLVAMGLQGMVS